MKGEIIISHSVVSLSLPRGSLVCFETISTLCAGCIGFVTQGEITHFLVKTCAIGRIKLLLAKPVFHVTFRRLSGALIEVVVQCVRRGSCPTFLHLHFSLRLASRRCGTASSSSTHIHTPLSKHGQNSTQSHPPPLRICPKVWLKVFYKLSCFCLASAVAPEDIQLINVPSQTEAGLKAAHEWLQPEHLGCSNSILWVFWSPEVRHNA